MSVFSAVLALSLAKVGNSPPIDLDANVLAVDDLAWPVVVDVVIRLEAPPIIIDPLQLPGRTRNQQLRAGRITPGQQSPRSQNHHRWDDMDQRFNRYPEHQRLEAVQPGCRGWVELLAGPGADRTANEQDGECRWGYEQAEREVRCFHDRSTTKQPAVQREQVVGIGIKRIDGSLGAFGHAGKSIPFLASASSSSVDSNSLVAIAPVMNLCSLVLSFSGAVEHSLDAFQIYCLQSRIIIYV